MILPPEPHQIDSGNVPLENTRGNLDVTSVPLPVLLRYVASQQIPMTARITAETFHDSPHLSLTWEL